MRTAIVAALLLRWPAAPRRSAIRPTAAANPVAGQPALRPRRPPARRAVSPLVGRWADSAPQCARPIEIFGNGTVRASDGSRGHWRLEGNRLTLQPGPAAPSIFTLVSITRDRVVLIDGNGQRGESIRCP